MNVTYGAFFSQSGARRLLLSSTIARMPTAMSTLAILLLVTEGSGPAAAGVAVGAHSLGVALGMPFQGRVVDRAGVRRTLPKVVACHAVLLLTLLIAIHGHLAVPIVGVLAFTVGALAPAIPACMRAAIPAIAPTQRARDAGYVVETAVNELSWILAPVVVAAIGAISSLQAVFVAMVLVEVVGTIWFIGSRFFGGDALGVIARATTRRYRPGRQLAPLLASVCLIGISGGITIVALPSLAETVGSSTESGGGLLTAAWAGGAALGGLAYGARVWNGPVATRYVKFVAVTCVAALPVASSPGMAFAVAFIALAGAPHSPVMACESDLVARIVPPDSITQAFAWNLGVSIVGQSAGAVASGWLLLMTGPRATLMVAAALLALAIPAAMGVSKYREG